MFWATGVDTSSVMIPEVQAGPDLDIYDAFYQTAGCVILRGVFTPAVMDAFNAWSEAHLPAVLAEHANTRHPKQASKRTINDVVERMNADQPALLATLLGNPVLNAALDTLLGHARCGAVTGHWLEPGGDRQTMHVDYPCHVMSGAFWEGDPTKLRRMFTRHQLENVLPHYSVQALVATDRMGAFNGSTEVVVGSHVLEGVDERVHDPAFQAEMEPQFVNAELEQGDVLLFNRRLVHRGGRNTSESRRNSLIVQYVWLFGIGQHAFDPVLRDTLPAELVDRIFAPFPIDTRDRT